MTRSAAVLAGELEAELEQYPEERGEILLEAADQWRRAGDHDRAMALLTDAVALGGEDGGCARVGLAEVLFALDRTEQAQAELDALRHSRPASPVPCHLAAELLEERGALEQALTWFNMAVSRLTEQEMAQRDTEFGAFSFANGIVSGRRRVRDALGLPPDELDRSVDARTEHADELFRGLTPPNPPRAVRVLFWPRTEIPIAHQTWPQLVEHCDVDAIMSEREAANRELSDAGVTRITMVPLTAARLIEYAHRTGGDPTHEDTRMGCLAEITAEGGTIHWPPARNASCWCGSAMKYKKCCGRPTLG
jgi:tetratricopeptide (TPR) repeat protein